MHRRTTQHHRVPFQLLFVVLLSVSSLLIPHTSYADSEDWQLSPSSISVSVPLGQKVERSITLTNVSGSSGQPNIYEAYPPAPALASKDVPVQLQQVALPQQLERLDEQLVEGLQAEDGETSDFLVYLDEQPDLSVAYQIDDWEARGQYVYETLVKAAEDSQQDLRAELDARGLSYQPFWIVNAIRVNGTLSDAQALAGRAEVAMVRANRTTTVPSIASTTQSEGEELCSPDQPNNPVCWHIRRINADRVWQDFGINGEGVVIANIDTGVRYDHPGLIKQYRGYRESGRLSHNYNWFDPQGEQVAPFDDNGHGTHTMGTIIGVGNAASKRPTVGVAPGAEWMAAQGCNGSFCTEGDLIASAQWLLAPTNADGNQPRPDLRAMIINNSWAGTSGDTWYAGYTAAWRAAGIFPVFAAGNTDALKQQVCRTVGSPGDYPDVVAVGATDFNNTIADFSLLGPSKAGDLKPDFVAPGTYESFQQGVLSTMPDDETPYQVLQGTSMAAPAVSGIVALIWSANPTLIGDYDETYRILRESAKLINDDRCDDPAGGPNNVYGHGLVDAYGAVQRARVDVPWLNSPTLLQNMPNRANAELSVVLDASRVTGPGTYNARLLVYGASLSEQPQEVNVVMRVTDTAGQATITGQVTSDTGAPVQADVGVKNGATVATDTSGFYSLQFAPGTYTLVAKAPSFLVKEQRIVVTGDQQINLRMAPDQPRLTPAATNLSRSISLADSGQVTIPISNTGTRPLYYNVQIPKDEFAIWRSDEPGGPTYEWIDLPSNAPTLKLEDDGFNASVPLGIRFPFYGYQVTKTLVAADGMLAFNQPLAYDGLMSQCLPDMEFTFYTIAPFRADLDPSRGGKIRYGNVGTESGKVFVLNYEDVPLSSGSATHTFQVLLHSDGRIVFQYRDLAPLPSQVSVGIHRAPGNINSIGCGSDTPIADGLAIEMRPQPASTIWMSTDVVEGVLQPGEKKNLPVDLRWMRMLPDDTYRGRLQIVSNDPLEQEKTVIVDLQSQPAPHERWLSIVGKGR